MSVFKSRVRIASEEFRSNRAGMLALIEEMRSLEGRAHAESQRSEARFAARGQLLPRERLARLLDPGAPYLAIGNMAGYAMAGNGADADRATSVPGGSLLAGIGFIAATRCMVVVNDSGINAGALGAASIAKLLRCQAIARQNRLPLVHLVESAGADIPAYRVEGWIGAGQLFANLALLSAAGLPVITLLHGSSTAGGAYMPGLSDVVVAVRGRAKAFLAGPPLLKAATGEIASDEELGGARMHAEVSGLAEELADDDGDAIRLGRRFVARLHWDHGTATRPAPRHAEPHYDPDEIAGVVSLDYRKPYDVREVLARIVDGSDWSEFKSRYGSQTVCVEAQVHGQPVAFIGNNGPIDNAGATKAAHFIQHCCQIGTPITYLQNTTGFMVGVAHERAGMIKHGSKMIQAVASASVPQFTFMIGASYGAGNYGMCGRGFNPRFLFGWPNSRIGLMGPEQAGATMRIVAEAAARRKGIEAPVEELAERERQTVAVLERQSDAFYVSGRGLDDGVIDPRDTRRVLSFLLSTADEARQRQLRPLGFAVARM